MAKSKREIDPASAVAADLQAVLEDLVALSLQSKQAHWNVVGPAFEPLHAMFDRMTNEYRVWYDLVAERLRGLGHAADGRPSRVSAATRVEDLPEGEIQDKKSIRRFLPLVDGLAARIRERLGPIGESDPVTQDMLIGIAEGLEKQAWMLRAQRG
jgi:starvation-inducible DNA-binding protein